MTRRKTARISGFARAAATFSLLALLGSACTAPHARRHDPIDAGAIRRVFVVHNKWHAAIVARRADISADALPEMVYFPAAEYLELSWGDADFFPAREGGIGLALKAAFWSRGSVVHLVGFSGAVRATYAGAAFMDIPLSTAEFKELIDFISAEFQRNQAGHPAAPRPGLFPQSRFFAAKSNFSLLRTCNRWVAEAFRAAGLPISPGYVFTAGNLARQLKPFASVK